MFEGLMLFENVFDQNIMVLFQFFFYFFWGSFHTVFYHGLVCVV